MKFLERKARRKRRKLERVACDDVEDTTLNDLDLDPPLPAATAPISQPPEPEPKLHVELSSSGRPVRQKRMTWKLPEMLPEPPEPVPDPPSPIPSTPEPEGTPFQWQGIRTEANAFGMFREYPCYPTHNPDDTISFEDLSYKSKANTSCLELSRMAPVPVMETNSTVDYFPFSNFSIFSLMNWMWSGPAAKSMAEFQRLVDILKSPFFKKEEVMEFDVHRETERLDNTPAHLRAKDGWREEQVRIHVPDGKRHSSDSEIPVYTIHGVHVRSLVEVIPVLEQSSW
ncbi:hypothetical protein VKT23_013944 [Stygiomarasmius scandens]|uniref:Uncharacterized protein n=1 Tax=Marasmiellus scandens TaxID=2682957 RepID=A0ABR1J4D9_9AGAR